MDSARNRRLWARQFAIWHGVYQFYVFFFFVFFLCYCWLGTFFWFICAVFSDWNQTTIEPRAQQPLLTQLWEYSIAARAAVFTNQGRPTTLVEPPSGRPPPSNTTGAAQCAGTVSERARPKVLMEQQFCVSFILRRGRQAYGEVCKLFWQSLSTYISYIHICIYIEHVCCPIERQIAPLIIRAAPCQSVPCRAVRRQCCRVSHISQLFSENCEMARLSFLERAKGCTVLHTRHSLDKKNPTNSTLLTCDKARVDVKRDCLKSDPHQL